MPNDLPGPMTPFDELTTTPELQILKLLIPYVPPSWQQALAFLIKYMELRETLRIFGSKGHSRAQSLSHDPQASFSEMAERFRPYLNPQQISILDQIAGIQEMMSFAEMFRNSQDSENGGDFSDDLMNLFGAMVPQGDLFKDIMKGNDKDGQRMDEQPGDEKDRSGETGTDPDRS